MRYYIVRFSPSVTLPGQQGRVISFNDPEKRNALRRARAGLVHGVNARLATIAIAGERKFVTLTRLAGPPFLGSVECNWHDPNAFVDF